MNRLSRSTALKIAAVLMVILSLVDIIFYQVPTLTQGAATVDAAANANAGPPFFMVIFSFTMDIVALVAAYGAWNAQRWGVVLLIITAILTGLPGLAGMLFAPDLATRLVSGVGVVLAALTIVLCLWREQQPGRQRVTA